VPSEVDYGILTYSMMFSETKTYFMLP